MLAEVGGRAFVTVPWEADWALPVEALLAQQAARDLLRQPERADRHVGPAAAWASWPRTDGLVLVDEAYVDFADDELPRSWSRSTPTCSSRGRSARATALAGLRFGYAIGHRPRSSTK